MKIFNLDMSLALETVNQVFFSSDLEVPNINSSLSGSLLMLYGAHGQSYFVFVKLFFFSSS
jgi:hypothetical protein